MYQNQDPLIFHEVSEMSVLKIRDILKRSCTKVKLLFFLHMDDLKKAKIN